MMPIYETSNKGIHHTHGGERWGALSGKGTETLLSNRRFLWLLVLLIPSEF